MLDHLESVLANEPVAVKSGQFIVEVKPQVWYLSLPVLLQGSLLFYWWIARYLCLQQKNKHTCFFYDTNFSWFFIRLTD
jgi:hypothetical protein